MRAVANSEVIEKLRGLTGSGIVSASDLTAIVEELDGSDELRLKDGTVTPFDGVVLEERRLPLVGSWLPVIGNLWTEYTWSDLIRKIVKAKVTPNKGETTEARDHRVEQVAQALELVTTGKLEKIEESEPVTIATGEAAVPVILGALLFVPRLSTADVEKFIEELESFSLECRRFHEGIEAQTRATLGKSVLDLDVLKTPAGQRAMHMRLNVEQANVTISQLKGFLERVKENPKLLISRFIRYILQKVMADARSAVSSFYKADQPIEVALGNYRDTNALFPPGDKYRWGEATQNIGVVRNAFTKAQRLFSIGSNWCKSFAYRTPAKPVIIGAAVLAAAAGVSYWATCEDDNVDESEYPIKRDDRE